MFDYCSHRHTPLQQTQTRERGAPREATQRERGREVRVERKEREKEKRIFLHNPVMSVFFRSTVHELCAVCCIPGPGVCGTRRMES